MSGASPPPYRYAALKGVPPVEVARAVRRSVAEIGLADKVHARARALSGGMKRKLCVGCALIGGSRVAPHGQIAPARRRSAQIAPDRPVVAAVAVPGLGAAPSQGVPGGSGRPALPGGRSRATGRPTSESNARASRLQRAEGVRRGPTSPHSRLQVALLDEPTSGMDPKSRRSLCGGRFQGSGLLLPQLASLASWGGLARVLGCAAH